MDQFAVLRQKAREAEAENDRAVASLLHPEAPSAALDPGNVWDVPLYETAQRGARETKAGGTDDERSYYNAVSNAAKSPLKRGENALVEHLERKSEKAKRARLQKEDNVEGVAISHRNAAFNARLER